MSGINGFNWKDSNLIKKMNDLLIHRGPDDEYIYIDNFVSLGYRNQQKSNINIESNPIITNKDKSSYILFDGSIKNFIQLKKSEDKVISQGSSINEPNLVLSLFEKFGSESFSRYEGMYAFCLYDKKNQIIYLVRDRIGQKPIYYYYNKDKFIFSSEIKTFIIFEKLRFNLDYNSKLEYLMTMNINSESLFKEIKSVKPGSYVKYDLRNNSIQEKEYFNYKDLISINKYANNSHRARNDLQRKLDELLNKSIKESIPKNTPVAAFCSGGVDSSLIISIAKRYTDNMNLYTLKIEDHYLDESIYAKKLAEHLNLNLKIIHFGKKIFNELLKKTFYLLDLPFIHPCTVGLYYLFQKVNEDNIKIALGGEGSDEIFGGYDHYLSLFRRLQMMKNPFFRITNQFFKNIVYFKNSSEMILEDKSYVIRNYPQFQWNKERNKMFMKLFNKYHFIQDNVEKKMQAIIMKDIYYYLPPTIREAERMSIAHGIEFRTPFLDSKLINFAMNLPLKYKITFFQTKHILKKVAERYMPNDLIYRKKMGFGIPIEKWLGIDDLNYRRKLFEMWEDENSFLS